MFLNTNQLKKMKQDMNNLTHNSSKVEKIYSLKNSQNEVFTLEEGWLHYTNIENKTHMFDMTEISFFKKQLNNLGFLDFYIEINDTSNILYNSLNQRNREEQYLRNHFDSEVKKQKKNVYTLIGISFFITIINLFLYFK